MEPFARTNDWVYEPIAQRMSFSSFSQSVDDLWGYNIERPYWVVLLPGYEPPADLDRGDKDAIWYPGEVPSPKIVWDGFCPVALHEIIRECFDYSGSSPYIKVVSKETKRIVKDSRDPEVMGLRPVRKPGWGPRKIQNHVMELNLWASLFPPGDVTQEIYGEILHGLGSEDIESRDSYQRSEYFMKSEVKDRGIFEMARRIYETGVSLRTPPACGTPSRKNPARIRQDKSVPLLSTTLSATIGHARLSIEDFRETGKPESYYRFAAQKGAAEMKAREEKNVDRSRRSSVEEGGHVSAESKSAGTTSQQSSVKDDNPF